MNNSNQAVEVGFADHKGGTMRKELVLAKAQVDEIVGYFKTSLPSEPIVVAELAPKNCVLTVPDEMKHMLHKLSNGKEVFIAGDVEDQFMLEQTEQTNETTLAKANEYASTGNIALLVSRGKRFMLLSIPK